MFGFFKATPFLDPALGELRWHRGFLRGKVLLNSGSAVPLAISGTRKGPEAQALVTAVGLATQFPSFRPDIEAALFEHYTPYADAVDADVSSPQSQLMISMAKDVWPHVSLAHVSVSPLRGSLVTELCYNVAWDEEHTLGLRFQGARFLELCGSVLPP